MPRRAAHKKATYLPNTKSIPANSNSSFGRGSLPTRSANRDLSSETICDTFATESFGNPVTRADKLTLPGARPHFKLLVSGTQIAVAMRLWLSASHCTTATGRRKPGPDPVGAGKSAHHISPCEITTPIAQGVVMTPAKQMDLLPRRSRPTPGPSMP
jgi:hypothetical protein